MDLTMPPGWRRRRLLVLATALTTALAGLAGCGRRNAPEYEVAPGAVLQFPPVKLP
jgi:hypothetical protein